MTAVRMGERLLYLGAGDPAQFAALAGKVGLTGRALGVVESEAAEKRLAAAAADAGLLVDIEELDDPRLAEADASIDVIVIDLAPASFVLALQPDQRKLLIGELFRVLRPGGRALVVEREPRRMFGLMAGESPVLQQFRSQGGSESMLRAGGFHPTRVLADRDGQRYIEGLKVQHP